MIFDSHGARDAQWQKRIYTGYHHRHAIRVSFYGDLVWLQHQPRITDTTMRHKNANPRKIPATMAFTSDIGGTAKTTTPGTKKHAPMIPRIGPTVHFQICIHMDCCTYIYIVQNKLSHINVPPFIQPRTFSSEANKPRTQSCARWVPGGHVRDWFLPDEGAGPWQARASIHGFRPTTPCRPRVSRDTPRWSPGA